MNHPSPNPQRKLPARAAQLWSTDNVDQLQRRVAVLAHYLSRVDPVQLANAITAVRENESSEAA